MENVIVVDVTHFDISTSIVMDAVQDQTCHGGEVARGGSVFGEDSGLSGNQRV